MFITAMKLKVPFLTQILSRSLTVFICKNKNHLMGVLAKIGVDFKYNFTCIYVDPKYMFDRNLAKMSCLDCGGLT